MKTSSSDNYICSLCGQEVEPVFLNGKKFLGKCQCEIESEQILKSEQKLREIQQNIIKELYKSSMMGTRFLESTFDNCIKRPGTEKVISAATEYLKDWEHKKLTGEGILIFGGTGSGKTHIAAAIANEVIHKCSTVVFVNVPDLLENMKISFKTGSTEDIIKSLEESDLLILDDAGAEKWSEWVESTLYKIINNRYNNRKPLIITTNCNISELREKIGFRSWSRIQEICLIVENTATDYRRDIAKDRIMRRGDK
jgi:DNA replication protein DnaC